MLFVRPPEGARSGNTAKQYMKGVGGGGWVTERRKDGGRDMGKFSQIFWDAAHHCNVLSLLGGAGRYAAAGCVPQLAQAGRHPVPQAARQAGGGRQGLRPHPPTQEEQQEDPHEGGHGAGGPG